jgi:hypothetical protein
MRAKARADRSSISEVCIDQNNQNTIATVAVRRHINDNFLSRESNYAHLDDVKRKRKLDGSQLF